MRRTAPLSIAALILWAAPAAAQTAPATPAHEHVAAILQAEVDRFREQTNCPGATLGFALADGTAGSVSSGFADVERRVAMTAEHRMLAGSVGKILFASLAHALIEEGKVALDAPISRYLGDEPWFARLPNASDITVLQLMNHTSGIPRHIMQPPFLEAVRADRQRTWKPEELIEFVFDLSAHFPAGRGFSYADTNFVLLAMIVERVTGEACYDEIRRRFLEPNELRGIVPSDRSDIDKLACGYVNPQSNLLGLDGARTLDDEGCCIANPQFEWAGGGYATTPRDLARFAQLLYAEDVLSEQARRRMLEHRAKSASHFGPGSEYGLGVMIEPWDDGDGRVLGHWGYFPGYLTNVSHFESAGFTLALQVNTTQLGQALNYTSMQRALEAAAARVHAIVTEN